MRYVWFLNGEQGLRGFDQTIWAWIFFIGGVRWSAESIQIFGDGGTDYRHRFYSRNTPLVRFDSSSAYKQVGDFLPQIGDKLLLCRFYYQKERWELWLEGETHSDHLAKPIICADSPCVSLIKISLTLLFFFNMYFESSAAKHVGVKARYEQLGTWVHFLGDTVTAEGQERGTGKC